MTRFARAAGHAALRALRSVRRRPLQMAVAVLAVAAALFLIGVARVADRTAESVADSWGGGVQMIVYLDDTSGTDHARRITEILSDLPAVERIEYVSKEQALAQVRSALGDHDELAAGIDPSMLPASLEVTLAAGVRDVAAAHPVVDKLSATAGVSQVEFLGDWVDRVTAVLAGVRGAGAAMFAVVAVIGILIISATLRLAATRRRREIEIAALFGASAGFERAPVLITGALQGIAAAVVALIALWLARAAVAPGIEDALATAFGQVALATLSGGEAVLMVAGGAMLGVLGAALSSMREAHA